MSRSGVRGGVVALTQTEIMLVLAVIILLLLLAKNAELGKVCDSLSGVSCAEILGHAEPVPESEIEPPAPETEITGTLVPGGGQKNTQPLGETPPEDSEPESSEKNETVIEETAKENTAPVSQTVFSKTDSAANRTEDATAASATDSDNAALRRDAENARRLREENARLKKENEYLRAQNNAPPNPQNAAGDIERKIGFLPCWAKNEKPFHYFAFNIVYADDAKTFRISPHRDVQSRAAVVRNARAAPLGAAILQYPKTPVGRETFLAFAQKIVAAQKLLYGENGCRLSATINEEVRGDTIKLVRDRAGFFPIYR